jgi:hypothetical protein
MHVLTQNKRPMLSALRKFKRCLFAVTALLVVAGCDSAKPLAVPPELLGTWRTQDPKYAGLFFKIDHGSFSFSTVEGNVESYAIVTYEQLDDRKQTSGYTHVLHGNRDGQKLQVNLSYEPLGGGRLKFRNQNKTTWSREETQK